MSFESLCYNNTGYWAYNHVNCKASNRIQTTYSIVGVADTRFGFKPFFCAKWWKEDSKPGGTTVVSLHRWHYLNSVQETWILFVPNLFHGLRITKTSSVFNCAHPGQATSSTHPACKSEFSHVTYWVCTFRGSIGQYEEQLAKTLPHVSPLSVRCNMKLFPLRIVWQEYTKSASLRSLRNT